MAEIDVQTEAAVNNDAVGALSFTELSRRMFDENIKLPWYKPEDRAPVDCELDSIYEIASAHQMPMLDFIARDPEYAVMCVEMSYAKWTNLLTSAAVTGLIRTEKGEQTVSKNQTKLIELRMRQAKSELTMVTDYAISMCGDKIKKRDHLLRTLYMNAVMHRDTKALIYLIDRCDGRPGETRIAELSYDNAYNIYMILHTLFDKQLQVLNSGNGTILICCSRRAGKTHMLVAMCVIECMRRPNTSCIYIGETQELTEGLVDDAMNKIVDACHLMDKKGNRFNWRHMDNGSKILVRGLSNTKDPDQIRGKGAKIIVIDEFFHLKSELLSYIQDQVLVPMQMDYADDYKFVCAGTPPKTKGTYGEYAWRDWDCPKFHWTWRENPHPSSLEAREALVEKALQEKGLTWDMPQVRREYNGEWAYDDELQLYPNYKTFDTADGFPEWAVSRVLIGIDYGVSDNDSIIASAWSDEEGRGYELFEARFNRLDVIDLKLTQLELMKRKVRECWILALETLMTGPIDTYDAESLKNLNKRILWDADDNDQHVTQELMGVTLAEYGEKFSKLKLQIANAHKTDKKIMWDKLDELMRTGRYFFIKNGLAEHECVSTVLKRGPNGEIINEVDDAIFHPDLLPPFRYSMYNVLGL